MNDNEINIRFESKTNLNVLQECGKSRRDTMSQDAISREFEKKFDKTGGIIYDKKGIPIIRLGSFDDGEGIQTFGDVFTLFNNDFVGIASALKSSRLGIFPVKYSGTPPFLKLESIGIGGKGADDAYIEINVNGEVSFKKGNALLPIHIGEGFGDDNAVTRKELKENYTTLDKTIASLREFTKKDLNHVEYRDNRLYFGRKGDGYIEYNFAFDLSELFMGYTDIVTRPIPISYVELLRLADTGNLIMGQVYQIVDYIVIPETLQPDSSAINLLSFMVHVKAISRHELSEEAYITTFADANYAAVKDGTLFNCKFQLRYNFQPGVVLPTTDMSYPRVTLSDNFKINGRDYTVYQINYYKPSQWVSWYKPSGMFICVEGLPESPVLSNFCYYYPEKTSDARFENVDDKGFPVLNRSLKDYLPVWTYFRGYISWLQDDLGNNADFDFYNIGFSDFLPLDEKQVVTMNLRVAVMGETLCTPDRIGVRDNTIKAVFGGRLIPVSVLGSRNRIKAGNQGGIYVQGDDNIVEESGAVVRGVSNIVYGSLSVINGSGNDIKYSNVFLAQTTPANRNLISYSDINTREYRSNTAVFNDSEFKNSVWCSLYEKIQNVKVHNSNIVGESPIILVNKIILGDKLQAVIFPHPKYRENMIDANIAEEYHAIITTKKGDLNINYLDEIIST